MKLEPNQERLKELLKETITLLCKNGLSYNQEFSVEGLIVVTLDKDTMFHANINETIKVPVTEELNSEGDEHGDNTEDLPFDSEHKSKRRRRKKRSLNGASKFVDDDEFLTDKSSPACATERESAVKSEPDDSDIVIVKEEICSYGGLSQGTHTNSYSCGIPGALITSPMQSNSHMPNYPNIAMGSQQSMTLSNMPLEGSSPWSNEQQQQHLAPSQQVQGTPGSAQQVSLWGPLFRA